MNATQVCSVAGCDGRKNLVRGLCVGHYTRLRRSGKISPEIPLGKKPKVPPPNNVQRPCIIDGCEKLGERWTAGDGSDAYRQMCGMHRARKRDSRDMSAPGVTRGPGKRGPNGEILNRDGYALVFGFHGHPAANAAGKAMAHRIVARDAWGDGPYECHWCHVSLTWEKVQVDHVDGNRINNVIANLVPSCAGCNSRRAHCGNPADFRPEGMAS